MGDEGRAVGTLQAPFQAGAPRVGEAGRHARLEFALFPRIGKQSRQRQVLHEPFVRIAEQQRQRRVGPHHRAGAGKEHADGRVGDQAILFIGEEFEPALDLATARDVAHGQAHAGRQAAIAGQHRQTHRTGKLFPVLARAFKLRDRHRAAGADAAGRGAQTRDQRNQGFDILADQAAGPGTEHQLGAVVGQHDQAGIVGHQHAIRGGLDDAAIPVFGGADGRAPVEQFGMPAGQPGAQGADLPGAGPAEEGQRQRDHQRESGDLVPGGAALLPREAVPQDQPRQQQGHAAGRDHSRLQKREPALALRSLLVVHDGDPG